MTEEQRAIVAENHNLIYSFAKKKDLDLEEYYDLLAIGLCKAGCVYDEDRGRRFSTLAYTCMYNEVKMYWRDMQLSSRIPENLVISYNELFNDGDDGFDSVELFRYLKDETEDPDVSEVYVEEFKLLLNERKRRILLDYMAGYSEREIAEALGVSRTLVCREIHMLRDLWLSYSETNKTNLFKNERKQYHADR